MIFAYGKNDPWNPELDADLVRIMLMFRTVIFKRCNHDESKNLAINELWGTLVGDGSQKTLADV